jgi:hypothetical protein
MPLFRHFITLVCILAATIANAADDLSGFYSSLRTVFTKHYPAVKMSTKDKTVTFDHDTRLFMIHEALKTGEWQEAREQRGPKKAGVYCEIVSESGPYNGAAVVPQAFNKHYFTVLLLAPYSRRLDRHLHVLLSYPADASKEFLREFTDTVNKFNDY